MSDVVAVVLAVALLALTAFFVGAEFALISARRTQFRIRSATSQPDSRALRGGPLSPVHAQVWVRRRQRDRSSARPYGERRRVAGAPPRGPCVLVGCIRLGRPFMAVRLRHAGTLEPPGELRRLGLSLSGPLARRSPCGRLRWSHLVRIRRRRRVRRDGPDGRSRRGGGDSRAHSHVDADDRCLPGPGHPTGRAYPSGRTGAARELERPVAPGRARPPRSVWGRGPTAVRPGARATRALQA